MHLGHGAGYAAGVDYTEAVETIARGFEVVGISIITIGGVIGIVRAMLNAKSRDSFYDLARDGFARPLLLGLGVLVAADIIETITIDRSLESAASLGLLVLIRVVLSFSLDAETDGVLPWHKAQLEADRVAAKRAEAEDRGQPSASL